MRVIFTGSRDWVGVEAEGAVTDILYTLHGLAEALGQPLEVVHGDCPTGADAIVDRWARRRLDHGVKLETYPAQWDVWGKKAGPMRNGRMIADGADMVIGFWRNGSRGTGGCLTMAQEEGIPTHVIEWNNEWSAPSRKSQDTTRVVGGDKTVS